MQEDHVESRVRRERGDGHEKQGLDWYPRPLLHSPRSPPHTRFTMPPLAVRWPPLKSTWPTIEPSPSGCRSSAAPAPRTAPFATLACWTSSILCPSQSTRVRQACIKNPRRAAHQKMICRQDILHLSVSFHPCHPSFLLAPSPFGLLHLFQPLFSFPHSLPHTVSGTVSPSHIPSPRHQARSQSIASSGLGGSSQQIRRSNPSAHPAYAANIRHGSLPTPPVVRRRIKRAL